MKAHIIHKKLLPQIPSASGVEIIGNHIFIIGDDSPLLYILDMHGNLLQQVSLFDTDHFATGRIAKSAKPDFEAMAVLELDGKKTLFVAGSGSLSPQRDGGYLIETESTYAATSVSLAGIYNYLRQIPEVVGSGKLNIEGAATDQQYMYLLQRGNITGQNILIRYGLRDFCNYLFQPSGQVPLPSIYTYILPKLLGKQAGFSGVCVLPGRDALLITATVEDTINEIDDGEVLGSFAGILHLKGVHTGQLSYAPVTEKNKLFIGKVESVAIQETLSDGRIKAIAVTDNDTGVSELLFMEIII